jgi:hypothetical protein
MEYQIGQPVLRLASARASHPNPQTNFQTSCYTTLYRTCASGPGYYFHAPSAADLRTAFREIGSQLSNLLLEQ